MTREEAAAILKRSVEELNDVLDGVTMSEGTEAALHGSDIVWWLQQPAEGDGNA